jgi:hypothetical protein
MKSDIILSKKKFNLDKLLIKMEIKIFLEISFTF